MKLMVLVPGFAVSWKTLNVFPTGFMLSGMVSNSFSAVATVCGVFVTMRKPVNYRTKGKAGMPCQTYLSILGCKDYGLDPWKQRQGIRP